MKYMVMECQFSYAVVLDEDGKFLKVANRHYQVGQLVTDVIEMQVPDTQEQPVKKGKHRWLYSVAAMAACLALAAMPLLRMGQLPYASVYMAINPEVRIDVNRKDMVVGLEGTNADGEILIEDYAYKRKSLDLVMDELVDRAIETGFLHEGGRITLTLDAEDGEWVVSRGDSLSARLDEHLSAKMSVTIEVKDTAAQKHEVIIPVAPGNAAGDSGYGTSENQAETDYENHVDAAAAGDVGAGDSQYDDGQTDYGDDGQTDYGNDGQSQYGNDGQSNYGNDGTSNYEDDRTSDYGTGGQSGYGSDGTSNYVGPDDDNNGQSAYDTPYDAGHSSYAVPDNQAQPVIDAPVSSTQPVHNVPGDDGQSDYSDQNNYDSQSNYDNQSNYGNQSNDSGQSSYDGQSNYDDD